jgi:hypothetical protein
MCHEYQAEYLWFLYRSATLIYETWSVLSTVVNRASL